MTDEFGSITLTRVPARYLLLRGAPNSSSLPPPQLLPNLMLLLAASSLGRVHQRSTLEYATLFPLSLHPLRSFAALPQPWEEQEGEDEWSLVEAEDGDGVMSSSISHHPSSVIHHPSSVIHHQHAQQPSSAAGTLYRRGKTLAGNVVFDLDSRTV